MTVIIIPQCRNEINIFFRSFLTQEGDNVLGCSTTNDRVVDDNDLLILKRQNISLILGDRGIGIFGPGFCTAFRIVLRGKRE